MEMKHEFEQKHAACMCFLYTLFVVRVVVARCSTT